MTYVMESDFLARIPHDQPYDATIELNTGFCDLRCVYCPIQTDQTQLEYPRQTMAKSTRAKVLDLLREKPPRSIQLAGNGETTLLDDWIEAVGPFLDLGVPTHLLSNFSRVFTEKEVQTLVRFSMLQISIDTSDPTLLKEIRRKVDLRTIVYNIAQIKSAAIGAGRPEPRFEFYCVLSSKVVSGAAELVSLAAAMGVKAVRFSELYETPTSRKAGLRSIAALPVEERKAALSSIEKAVRVAESLKLEFALDPILWALGRRTYNGDGSGLDGVGSGCLMPWSFLAFHGDVSTSLCCMAYGKTDLGSARTIDQIRNSPEAIQARKDLLEGRPNPLCRECTLRLPIDHVSLAEVVSKQFYGGQRGIRPASSSRARLSEVAAFVTEHCNLNCKRCGHFSSISPKKFLDVEIFEKDLKRLSLLFGAIDRISLTGGEPLLHKGISGFIEKAREAFPRSEILCFTNGLLLPKASEAFWESCRKTGAIVNLSLYPPMKPRIGELIKICERERVKMYVKPTDTFYSWMNLKGDSVPEVAFANCKKFCTTPVLHQSQLYTCVVPPVAHHFNRKYGSAISAEGGIDIHRPDMTGEKILELLNQPIPACRYCAHTYDELPWERGVEGAEDWDVLSSGSPII